MIVTLRYFVCFTGGMNNPLAGGMTESNAVAMGAGWAGDGGDAFMVPPPAFTAPPEHPGFMMPHQYQAPATHLPTPIPHPPCSAMSIPGAASTYSTPMPSYMHTAPPTHSHLSM